MNWPVIWGVIKFDDVKHIAVPNNFYAGDRISIRFSKDKAFDPAIFFGCELYKLNETEISFEILCSTWKPDDLNNNEEEWCTSDMDYFSPDEIEIEQKKQFSKVLDLVFKENKTKREFTYTFDMLYIRLKNLQNAMIEIINLPNIKEITFYFTDSHGDIEICDHELWDWKIEEFADKYINFCSKLIEEGYFSDILSSYYLTYKVQNEH